MNRKELLRELWKFYDRENTKKYSFEAAWSIITIAEQDGRFEDKNIIVTFNQSSDNFSLKWKN